MTYPGVGVLGKMLTHEQTARSVSIQFFNLGHAWMSASCVISALSWSTVMRRASTNLLRIVLATA
ncbi:hypothetical protein ACSDR0_43040 [Streptosporangium sp. G11]|uniref:hypothetical protein n=1 Tax=Streptosporangium sp. G11 TaxID=3436926 RepID=UPI003EB7B225